MAKGNYSKHFYQTKLESKRQSAAQVVPIVLDWVQPKSVVDIGCGSGTWLAAFEERGVEEILGVDGSYVNPEWLDISVEKFTAHDLKEPFKIDREFDLAVSLEVAEHLDPERAEPFVDSLTRLAPVIMFSAAIPFQEGTHHVNEQWPEYWAKLFKAKGYVAIDCIRSKIWTMDNVAWWYAQNVLIFAKEDMLKNYPALHEEYRRAGASEPLSMVHPKMYLLHILAPPTPIRTWLKGLSSILPGMVKHALEMRLRKFLSKSVGSDTNKSRSTSG